MTATNLVSNKQRFTDCIIAFKKLTTFSNFGVSLQFQAITLTATAHFVQYSEDDGKHCRNMSKLKGVEFTLKSVT